jgi:hypothetical protein
MTRFIAAQLFGLSAIDIPTVAGACVLLLVVALAATLVPARRATHAIRSLRCGRRSNELESVANRT